MADFLNRHFESLRSIFAEVLKLKNAFSDRSAELAEKRKFISLLFVLLKKINRLVKYRARTGREELHRGKALVDSNRLQLQNLLYEVNHLKREIRHCHQFKSHDEDIDVLPEQEYLALVYPEQTGVSAHAKRLGRLEWELNMRKQLSTYYRHLVSSKKQVFKEIVLKMELLTSFAPSLRTLLKASRPLQDALELQMDRKWKLSQQVNLLPQPLYLAYINLHALEAVMDTEVCISFVGADEEFPHLEVETQMEFVENFTSNSDEMEKNSMKRKEYDEKMELLHMPRQVLEPHPLVVRLSIGNQTIQCDYIIISLRYFQHLGFVTASATINLNKSDETAGECASQNILKYLYENDVGDKIPVSGAEYEVSPF